MTKFKVGDLVRAAAAVSCGGQKAGDLAVVVQVRAPHQDYEYFVKFLVPVGTDDGQWNAGEKEIEPVEDTE